MYIIICMWSDAEIIKTTVELGGRPPIETGGIPMTTSFCYWTDTGGDTYQSLDHAHGYMMEVDCINTWILMAYMYVHMYPCHISQKTTY